MSLPVIAFDNVSKQYPLYHHFTGGIKSFLFDIRKNLSSLRKSSYETLRDISFQVYRGEAFGIIGANGAGKSTTLGLIAGVIRPSRGTTTVQGKISSFLDLGSGFHHELTGRENIVLNGVLMGLTRRDVQKKMREIMDFSELGGFIDQPIRVYSSGMLARLGFSVIAHLEPEILLIDEILAVGDSGFQKKCIEKMMGFKKNGVTMVFVSHSMTDVQRICDRVMWIENHTVRRIGQAGAVVAEYRGN